MNSTTAPQPAGIALPRHAPAAARSALQLLQRLQHGSLSLQLPDGSLAAVVAEVNNTFGERHVYLLAGPDLAWGTETTARKVFHVSPFCSVDGDYRFRFERREAHALARVDLHDADGPLLQTSVGGALVPMTAAAVRRAVFGMPFMTLGVVGRIHWQALRLWVKRVPFFRKPEPPRHAVSRSA